MIVSHRARLIIVGNPKVASTSLDHAFASLQDDETLNGAAHPGYYTRRHMPAAVIRERVGEAVWSAYLKVAFVRNPWDWVVSQCAYNRMKLRPFFGEMATRISRDDVLETYEILREHRGVPWFRSASQCAFVCDAHNIPMVDFVGRFETIESDVAKLAAEVGVVAQLPHLNRSAHAPFQVALTSDAWSLVSDLYADDIVAFGY